MIHLSCFLRHIHSSTLSTPSLRTDRERNNLLHSPLLWQQPPTPRFRLEKMLLVCRNGRQSRAKWRHWFHAVKRGERWTVTVLRGIHASYQHTSFMYLINILYHQISRISTITTIYFVNSSIHTPNPPLLLGTLWIVTQSSGPSWKYG